MLIEGHPVFALRQRLGFDQPPSQAEGVRLPQEEMTGAEGKLVGQPVRRTDPAVGDGHRVLHAPGHGEGGHGYEGRSHTGRLVGPDSLENSEGFGDRLDRPAGEQQNEAPHRFELVSKIGVVDALFGSPEHNFGLDRAAAIDPQKTESPENRRHCADPLIGGTLVEAAVEPQEDIALLFPSLAEQGLAR